MFSLTTFSVLVSLFISSQAQVGPLPKGSLLFIDGLSPHVDGVFNQYLHATASSTDNWGAGWIPEACANAAHDANLSPRDVTEIFNVHYTDCGDAWTFCRHKNAPISRAQMVDLFGRLPVHERQWVRHVMAFPGDDGAYEWFQDIVFFGNTGRVSVWQHETAHAVDEGRSPTHARSSDTTAYKSAVNSDTCVPDSYANTNYVEDYAQVSVLSLYEIVNPGGLDPVSPAWRCLEKSKNSLDSFQREDMWIGGTCYHHEPNSRTISINSAKFRRFDEGSPRRIQRCQFGSLSSNITVI